MAADRETFFAGLTALICLEIAPSPMPQAAAAELDEITQVFRPAAAPTGVRRTPTVRLTPVP